MDLNYLYQRHQISLFMSTDQVRRVHGEFADLYAARIADARHWRAPLRAV